MGRNKILTRERTLCEFRQGFALLVPIRQGKTRYCSRFEPLESEEKNHCQRFGLLNGKLAKATAWSALDFSVH